MKKIFLILFLFSFSKSYSQTWKNPKVSIGTAFRLLPWYKYVSKEKYFLGLSSSLDMDNRTRLSIDIEEKLPGKNNFYISSSNYISFEKVEAFTVTKPGAASERIKRFKRDHFLNLIYVVKTKSKKPKAAFIGLGAGIMNCNTKYVFSEDIYGFTYRTFYSQRVFATNFIAGIQYEALKGTVTLHSFGAENFQIPKNWLEVKFSYVLHPLGKNKEKFSYW